MEAQVDRCTSKATQIERTGGLIQNVVGPKGWKASKRDTNMTRNDTKKTVVQVS